MKYSKRYSMSLLLLLFLIISVVIGRPSVSNSGWLKQSAVRTSTRDKVNKKNLFAFDLQSTISRSVGSIIETKKQNHPDNVDKYASWETRNAFIDHTKEATVMKETTKPHLKHKSSLKRDASSVIKTNIITASVAATARPLVFWESMVSGAVSRSIAQTVMHPANTMKTMMQSSLGPTKPRLKDLLKPQMFHRLTCGAGANFVLSLPHGAFNFAVLESIRERMSKAVDSIPMLERNKQKIGPGLDFLSSSIATICCSVVSTPQMMITDNIMAGNYPNLISATNGLYASRGVMGFYSGWWPGLVGKIPSYALTWTFFQQIKRIRNRISDRLATNYENTIMGCMASATTVCIMIPMDTIKTRLVTQTSVNTMKGIPYNGIIDCGVRIAREEGIKTFYRGLAPRLLSVVPMIGIQFGVYEAMKKVMIQRSVANDKYSSYEQQNQ
mmetsp:Transcript_8800/g.21488  ORF Transcript_8800/g.21488 Transcript_8800/m.21488 type:complete len:441 (+) Transcript_8800:221-1543(+)